MQKSYRFILSGIMLGAFLLSACTGVVPQQDSSTDLSSSSNSQSNDIVFTGTVEAMNGAQWLISGQQVSVDGLTLIDANLQVGDSVKVEATVSQDGEVLALSIELPGMDALEANDSSSNSNDDVANSNDNTNSANDNSNVNSNDAAGAGQEAYGVVEALTDSTITVDGVTYNLADFTEFKDIIAVGDQVKIHVIVNADGSITINEIEIAASLNANSNGNSNDDQGISNSNGNSNDDNNSNNDDEHDDEHDDD